MTRLSFDARIAPCSETAFDGIRNACDVADSVATWRESLAAGCFLKRGAGAEIQIDHDGAVVGAVDFVFPHRGWHIAQCTVEGDDPTLLERIRPGQPVSIDAHALDTTDDVHLYIRRHDAVLLHHLAVLRDRDVPGYRGAKILSVRKLGDRQRSSGDGWLDGLPDHWKDFVIGLEPGAVTELIEDRRVAYRWNGTNWVGGGVARAA